MKTTPVAGPVVVVLFAVIFLVLVLPCMAPAQGPPMVASSEDPWTSLDGCRAELDAGSEAEPERLEEMQMRGRKEIERALACEEAAQRLAERAEAFERERLFALLEEETDDGLRAGLLRGVLRVEIQEAIDRLPVAAAQPAAIPKPKPELPERLRSIPSELQAAWQLGVAIEQSYWQSLANGKADEGVSFQEHQADFEKAVTDFLRGKTPARQAIPTLSSYVWGGGCGHGADRFFEPQRQALGLARLATGDPGGAAAALTGMRRSSLSSVEPDGDEQRDRRLLTAAGYDWELVYLGRVLDSDREASQVLARDGSDRALRLLFTARNVHVDDEGDTRLSDESWFLRALGGLVQPSSGCEDYTRSGPLEAPQEVRANPVAPDLEAEVLELLAGKVGRGAGLREAETAAHLLATACRFESLPAFRTMVRSPYSRVREAGAQALRSFGEKMTAPRPAPPVSFRIVLDGAPAAEMQLDWTLAGAGGVSSPTTSSSSSTNSAGVLALERDPFLDAKNRIEVVRLSTPTPSSPDALWFSVTMPHPRSLDTIVPVRVTTQTLSIACPEAEHRPVAVILYAVRPDDEESLIPVSSDQTLRSSAPLTFKRLERGRYELTFFAEPGFFVTEEIILGDKPLAITCSGLSVGDGSGGPL